mgnify:CR=1 FL=1
MVDSLMVELFEGKVSAHGLKRMERGLINKLIFENNATLSITLPFL